MIRKDGQGMNSLVLKIIIFVTAVAGVGFVTYGAYTYKTNLENQAKEAATQVVVEVKDDSKTNIESVVNKTLEEQEIKVDYMVREIDKQTMYITDNIIGYEGPNEVDFKEKINFTENQEIQVIGVVEQYKNESCLWYLLEGNTFVNGGYVSDKPIMVESNTYDAEVNAPKVPEEIIEESPLPQEDLEKLAEMIMRDYNAGLTGGEVHHVPQEILDELGATEDTGAKRPGVVFGQTQGSDSLKGGRLE